jgi:hypothetical protein
VAKVEASILSDSRITIEGIVLEVGISYGSVLNIIHSELHMTKVPTEKIGQYFINSGFIYSLQAARSEIP